MDGHTNYEHSSSVQVAQESVCAVIFNKLEEKLRKSPCFAIIMDESTDVHVDQNLILYIKFVNIETGRAETHYFSVVNLGGAKASDIFTAVLKAFEDKKLSLASDTHPNESPLFVAVSTNGAATMVGCKSGVVTKIREEVCPHLISILHSVGASC